MTWKSCRRVRCEACSRKIAARGHGEHAYASRRSRPPAEGCVFRGAGGCVEMIAPSLATLNRIETEDLTRIAVETEQDGTEALNPARTHPRPVCKVGTYISSWHATNGRQTCNRIIQRARSRARRRVRREDRTVVCRAVVIYPCAGAHREVVPCSGHLSVGSLARARRCAVTSHILAHIFTS